MSDHPILPYAEPVAPPPPPPLPTTGAVPAPMGSDDPNYHCANCLFIPMPSDPAGGFWACQNLCERD